MCAAVTSLWIPAYAGMTEGVHGHPLRTRFACSRPLTLREGDEARLAFVLGAFLMPRMRGRQLWGVLLARRWSGVVG